MPTATSGPSPGPAPFQPLAAALAWVFPGAGHYVLGHTRRAVLICAGILGLFGFGVFIGGISCIDRRESFFWFLGQALAGPIALGIDYVHQNQFKAYDAAGTGPGALRSTADLDRLRRRAAYPYELLDHKTVELVDSATNRRITRRIPFFRLPDPTRNEKPAPPYTKSLGRAGELGTLFCTIAGFMNLICIIDAAWRRRAQAAPSTPSTPTP